MFHFDQKVDINTIMIYNAIMDRVSIAKIALVGLGVYIGYKLGLELWCAVYGLLH